MLADCLGQLLPARRATVAPAIRGGKPIVGCWKKRRALSQRVSMTRKRRTNTEQIVELRSRGCYAAFCEGKGKANEAKAF